MASVKITVFGMQCLGDNMEAIFSCKIFVFFYLTELHYIPLVGNLAAVTSCIMPCFTFTESSRLHYVSIS
jgi:hypothetical protein